MLSCLASAGVIGTAILSAKATPRAEALVYADSLQKHDGNPYAYTKKEAFAVAWKCYIPTAIVGASTIACIIGANALNRHQQAALISAYALVQNSYKDYKSKLKELYGEETHQAVMNSIIKERVDDVTISATGAFYCSSLDFGKESEPDVVHTFYDNISERYFETTTAKVIEAEYHLNRNFVLGGEVSLNEFYEFLGLEKTDFGETFGWTTINGDIYWLDFNHYITTLDDGLQVYVIEPVFDLVPWWNEDI